MISATHLIFGLSMAYILDKRILTASIFAIVPDFDITFNFLYPFVHRGIMHSLLAGMVFSGLVFVYSEDLGSAESCFAGYTSHLMLDSLTSSGVPLFFPVSDSFSLSLVSAYSLKYNSVILVLSLFLIYFKKNYSTVRKILEGL